MSAEAKPNPTPASVPSVSQSVQVPPQKAENPAVSMEKNVKAMLSTEQAKVAERKPAPEAKPDAKADAPAETKPVEKPSIFDKVKKPDAKSEAKPDAGTPEADPIDSWNLPKNASEESVKNFGEIRSVAKQRLAAQKEAERKLIEATQQLETYRKASPADTERTKALESQLKDAQDKLAIYDLRSHPDFVKQYVEPKSKALTEAKEVLAYNGNEADLNALLGKPVKDFNAAVSKMTEGMNSMDATTVQTALRQAYKLHSEEAGALSKSSELHQSLTQKAALQQKQAFEEVSGKLGPMGDFLSTLDIPEGIPADAKASIETYNNAVSQVRANAEKIAFGKMDEKGMAMTAYKAATMDFLLEHTIPRMEVEYRQLVEAHSALAKEFQALRGGKGPANVTLSQSSTEGGGPDLSKMTLEQGVTALLHQGKK